MVRAGSDHGDEDGPVSAQDSEDRKVDTARPRESFSQLLARILDQLSLSAWLPAAAVVFSTLLLVNVRTAEGQIGGCTRKD